VVRKALSSATYLALCLCALRAFPQRPPGQPTTLTVTVVFTGEGTAQVTTRPAGINCPGSACTFTWNANPSNVLFYDITPPPGMLATMLPICSPAGSTAPVLPGKAFSCGPWQMFGGSGTVTLWVHRPGELAPNSPAPNGIVSTSASSGSNGIGSSTSRVAGSVANGLPLGLGQSSNCSGIDCLTILAVRTGTRCGSPTSVEVDARNDSSVFLRGYVIFNTPTGKLYSPTGLLTPGQVLKGVNFVCKGDPSASSVSNIGPDLNLLRYPPKN
jgi:hypothetical protein